MSISKEIGLYRTARPRWNLYATDGLGRDSYISFNNGGFWKQNINPIIRKPNYPIYHDSNYHSLHHNPAPFKYYSDGSGRDSYILVNDGGLKYNHLALNKFHLQDFLRTPDSCIFNFQSNPLKEGVRIKTHYISKDEMRHETSIREVEKGLIKRLFTQENKKREGKTRNHLKKAYNPYLRVHDREYPNFKTESKYIETITNDKDIKRTKERVSRLEKFEFGAKDRMRTNPDGVYAYRPIHTVDAFFPSKCKKTIQKICLTEAN